MAQVARFKAWNLPLPENVTRLIVGELEGHIWYPPQEDLTLSDDEEIEIVRNPSPGPIDSDDDMPVAEAWRRKLAAPVQPPARKRARRTVESDVESDDDCDSVISDGECDCTRLRTWTRLLGRPLAVAVLASFFPR